MNRSYPVLRRGYVARLFQLLLFTLFGLVVAGLLMGVIMRIGGLTPRSLRIATVVQDIMVFVVPAILTACMVTSRPDELLETGRGFRLSDLIMAVVIMIVSIPFMNFVVVWNESISLPQCLHGVESWMREAEDNARGSVEMVLGGTSVGDLVVSLLIVGLLAGFSEELFFRGALQRLLASERLNPHVAIWITAFIFSSFHVQFYGFFPRLLLGAYFGYLLYKSGSIWLPVTVHACNNAMVVITTRCENTGSELAGINEYGADSVMLITLSVILTATLCVVYFKKDSFGRIAQP